MGTTPMAWAKAEGHNEIAKILSEASVSDYS